MGTQNVHQLGCYNIFIFCNTFNGFDRQKTPQTFTHLANTIALHMIRE